MSKVFPSSFFFMFFMVKIFAPLRLCASLASLTRTGFT